MREWDMKDMKLGDVLLFGHVKAVVVSLEGESGYVIITAECVMDRETQETRK